jgi:predicted acylesterase/phospholipase RssA
VPDELRTLAIMSSAAIPAFFPPVEIDNMRLVDGGVFQAIEINDPIERCRDEVENDSDIIIDMILCFEEYV